MQNDFDDIEVLGTREDLVDIIAYICETYSEHMTANVNSDNFMSLVSSSISSMSTADLRITGQVLSQVADAIGS